jgi:hypothetical protein
MTTPPSTGAGGEHLWTHRFGLTCCKRCGIVRRRDRTNKPCPGPVRVGLRDRVGGDRFAPPALTEKQSGEGHE